MNTKLVESLVQIIYSLDPKVNQNLAEYAGVIQLTVDPLEYQQKIRDEYLSSAEAEDSRRS